MSRVTSSSSSPAAAFLAFGFDSFEVVFALGFDSFLGFSTSSVDFDTRFFFFGGGSSSDGTAGAEIGSPSELMNSALYVNRQVN